MEQYFIIGKIINTHGINGELKILPLTDDIKRFNKLKQIYIEKNGNLTLFTIQSVRYNNNFVIIKLETINDMTSAQQLKECYIKINRENAAKLPKGSYYISDMIGLDVKTDDGEYLGKIKDILQPGGNDIYVIDYNECELLIPATKEVVKSIDLENKIMMVKLLEGLKDI